MDDETQKAIDEATAGLKKKNDELLGKMKERDKQLKAFDGIDPDSVRELMAAHEKTEAEAAKKAGDWEAREKKLTAAGKKKEAELNAIIADQKQRYSTTAKEKAALAAIAGAKASRALLEPVLLQRLQVDDSGDTFNVYAEVDGVRMDADKLVESLKADPEYAGAFPGPGVSGSGSEPLGAPTDTDFAKELGQFQTIE